MSRPRVLVVGICFVLACGFSSFADAARMQVSANPQGPPGCQEPAPSIIGTIQFDSGAVNPIYAFEDGAVTVPVVIGGGGGGTGTGNPKLEPITVVQMAGAETAQLFGNAVTGIHIPFAEIDIFDAAGGVSVHMRLDDVIVIGFSLLPGAGADRPFNRISLNYEKISITSGGVTRCWNSQTNSPAC